MQAFQRRFIELAVAREALRFGRFELKSGRISPYFFNAGSFCDGGSAATLGQCYAAAIAAAEFDFDFLFGPAYKGIPLVVATAIALAEHHGRDLPWCFNRKETKDHGEGGNLVGAALNGRVLIIDDVITAGTAIREAVEIILGAGATIGGVVIALDRQERGQGATSAIQEVEETLGIRVTSIIKLEHLLEYLQTKPGHEQDVAKIQAYRELYGVS